MLVEYEDPNDENIPDTYIKEYRVVLEEDKALFIYLENIDGGERFTIDYEGAIAAGEEKYENIDLEMMTQLVNSVSGRSFDLDLCEEFLYAEEEDFAAEKYGRDKLAEMEIYKMVFLNFFEDWGMWYILTNRDVETLTFWGLTQQLEK